MTLPKPFWLRYGAAVLLPVAAAALRLDFLQVMGNRNVYLTFYPAVILAALYGGFWPGLLATALSAGLADYSLLLRCTGSPSRTRPIGWAWPSSVAVAP